ncbi:nuclear transport factor 2 family protein [Saccharomonospora xinjiangensis]|uniref:nuclear transport factor 2 family protein n=1 Tax=Saccharomonospora xinjiangensis TaxID=75294 RepID=UPI0010C29579|nr:nuclear transport factor 2 family protein [Saccharomonospora xinjiangensis]QBQ60319.1 hypothetical protein EYD13_09815 [Saccharomonospora xinjiangensis]
MSWVGEQQPTSPGSPERMIVSPFDGAAPEQFIAEFFERFGAGVADDGEDLTALVDRFHTPDVVQVADGHRMDRDKLIAHARAVRRHHSTARIIVHEALAVHDRIAARYRMHVERATEDGVEPSIIDVCFFGQFAADGRMRRADMLTRMERRQATGPGASGVTS